MFTKSTVVFQRTQRLFYFTRSFNRAVNTCYITIPNRTKYYTSCVAHVMCTQYESYSVKLPESICSGENSMRFKRDRYCCSNTLVVFPFGMGTCSMYGTVVITVCLCMANYWERASNGMMTVSKLLYACCLYSFRSPSGDIVMRYCAYVIYYTCTYLK